jgi:hypothetical protein
LRLLLLLSVNDFQDSAWGTVLLYLNRCCHRQRQAHMLKTARVLSTAAYTVGCQRRTVLSLDPEAIRL